MDADGSAWFCPDADGSERACTDAGDSAEVSPGAEGTVFWGSRSYNFHSWYGFALGIFAQARWVPSPPAAGDFILGVQIDGEFIAMPSILIFSALRNQ